MKTGVTISLAQVPVVRGDITANLEQHLEMVKQSAHYKADVVVFPELSLTGYELDLAAELAFSPQLSSFKQLSQAAVDHQVIVIAGCPLISDTASKPTIGAVVCFPSGDVEFYSKQYLHAGEEEYCSYGSGDYCFEVNGHKVVLAICADFSNPAHSQRAKQLGAEVYIASALISENGFNADAEILSGIASKHGFPVLLSNHISKTGGWETCGKSSMWDSQGKLVDGFTSNHSGLVLCRIGNGVETVNRVTL